MGRPGRCVCAQNSCNVCNVCNACADLTHSNRSVFWSVAMCNLKPNFSPPLNAEIYTKHPILHTRCKIGCVSFKLLIISVYCGAGGNRTLVQTRKTQAFYMLIFDYIFVQRQNQSHQPMPYPLKLHLRREAGADYPRFGCTTWPECFGATASE